MRRISAALCSLFATVTLAPLSASAVQGDSAYRSASDARTERVLHADVQARLAQSPAWQAWRSEHGPRWFAQWDEATGTPYRFWGEGFDVDPIALGDDTDAWDVGAQILAGHPDLLGPGVATADLTPLSLDRRAGITTLTWERSYIGLPVHGARVSLRFVEGRFVMGQVESMPGIRRSVEPTFPAGKATPQALASLGWAAADTVVLEGPQLQIVPLLGDLLGQADYKLAWHVELRSTAVVSHRDVWIDAEDGSLVAWEERIRFASGVLAGEIDNRYPQAGLTEAPLIFADLSSDGGSGTTDGAGAFSVSGDTPSTFEWEVGSEWVDISTFTDGGLTDFTDTLEADGDTLVGVPPASGDTGIRRQRAQLDSHVSLHVVRQRALDINPAFPWAGTQAEMNINRNDATCNAWFDNDSSINFVRQGGGCNNSARVADVVYHEYGHGFHAWSIISGAGGFDGALSEGLSDYMAATITGDSNMSPGFFSGTTNPLREIHTDRVWPTHIDADPHITGLIIAGALWDLRTELIADLGPVDGVAQADHIMWQIASRASDIPSSYAEAILADDDNGNLSDGTPNQCAIDETFGLHGLGPGAGIPTFYIDHTPLAEELTPDSDITVSVGAALSNPECAAGDVGTVRLFWSDDPAAALTSFEVADLGAVGGDLYETVLPGIGPHSYLRYRIELLDVDGSSIGELPAGSRTDPWFASWVGPRDVLFTTDFESDDGSFTHSLISGPDQEGADDWSWGEAGGFAGDPSTAHSGSLLWGNDITPLENWNGAYQPNVHNVLRSPVLEVPTDASPVLLQYRRWLTVEDGFYDRATLEVNGSVIWQQFSTGTADGANQHHVDTHWAFRSYDITDLVEADGTVSLAWHLLTDAGLEMGGWNVDDVRLVTPGEVVDPGDDDDATPPDDDDDATSPDDDDDAVVADDDDDTPGLSAGFSRAGSGCGCSSASPSRPGLGLLLLGLAGLGVRRRRS